MTTTIDPDMVTAYVESYKTLKRIGKVAALHNIQRDTLVRYLAKAGVFLSKGHVERAEERALPTGSDITRYIITSAQNNTRVNIQFLKRLKSLSKHYKATLMVCPWTYNPITSRTDDYEKPIWDEAIVPYLVTSRTKLSPKLVLCAELSRILPTAVTPLSGFETYAGLSSAIIPHAKIAMLSVATMKDEPAKFLYTTGAVTHPNYSRTKAGFKGEHHHAFAALMVEITESGFFVRQLHFDNVGSVHDLDVVVTRSGVSTGNTVDAIVMGDVHVAEADQNVISATWGENGLVMKLKPRVQILHDIFDMRSRPWQDDLNFHRQFEKHVNGCESVEEEVVQCKAWLAEVSAMTKETVVVRSNHDLKLEKWLNSADYKKDLVNAHFFLRMQLAKVESILAGDSKFKVLAHALAVDHVKFLEEDESYVLYPDASGGIECGNHGHLGANGSRGTPTGFTKMSRKQIIGDKHSAAIVEGVYVVGSCALSPAYARGPSSWSPTHCIVYKNGKRSLVTASNGQFYAGQFAA